MQFRKYVRRFFGASFISLYRYSLFAIRYSLFTIRYSLFAIRYSLFTIRYSLFAIHVSRQTLFSSEVVVYLYFWGKFGICYIVSNRHFFPSKIICYDCHLERIFISLKSLRLSIVANYHIATFHYFLYFICHFPFI